MTENENRAVKISVQFAVQGLAMTLGTLDLVRYLLSRVQGDLAVHKLAKDGGLDSLCVAIENISRVVDTVRGLQQSLLNIRNDVGTYGAARLMEDQVNQDAKTQFQDNLKNTLAAKPQGTST